MKNTIRAVSVSLLTSLFMTGSGQAYDYPGLGFYTDHLDGSNQANQNIFNANYQDFQTAVGQPAHFFDLFVDYRNAMSTWADSAGFGAWSLHKSPLAAAVPVVSLGLVAGTNYNESTAAAEFDKIASPTNNEDAVFNGVLSRIAPYYTTIYLRIGWEQNIPPYEPWSATSDNTIAAKYVAAWRHVADLAHNNPYGMTIKTVWSPACGVQYCPINVFNTYPGDAYVDVIAPDLYSPTTPGANPVDFTTGQTQTQSVWATNYVNREHFWDYPNGTYYDPANEGGCGFLQCLNYAVTHNKPFGLTETGAGTKSGTYEVADDGDYPLWLGDRLSAAIFQGLPIAFVNVWNNNPGDGNWQFTTPANRPNESAAWADFAMTMAHAVNLDVLPAGQTETNVGGATPVGATTYGYNQGYVVKAGGSDIYYAADSFKFVGQDSTDVTNDQTLITCVTGLTNTSTSAKAGLMFRETSSANSRFVMVDVRPNGALEFLFRTSPGANAGYSTFSGPPSPVPPSPTAPVWLRLVKSGANYTASYATTMIPPTGTDWHVVATKAGGFGTSGTYKEGLAVCSHANGTLITATFANAGYIDKDVNGLRPPGTASASGGTILANGVYTLNGGGKDIYNAADQFNFAYKPFTGDQTMIARVTSFGPEDPNNTFDANAKAGVMFRDGVLSGTVPAPGAVSILAEVHGGTGGTSGVQLIVRSTTGGNSVYTSGPSLPQRPSSTNPVWLRLVKSGTTITASYALTVGTPAAGDWLTLGPVAGTALTFTSGVPYFGGMAVTSHNASVLATATFDNVTQ